LAFAAAARAAPVNLPLAFAAAVAAASGFPPLTLFSAVAAVSGFPPCAFSGVEPAFPGFEVSIEALPWALDELPLAEDPGVLSLGFADKDVAEAGTEENKTATAIAIATGLDIDDLEGFFANIFLVYQPGLTWSKELSPCSQVGQNCWRLRI
jgi:hypothetical protein